MHGERSAFTVGRQDHRRADAPHRAHARLRRPRIAVEPRLLSRRSVAGQGRGAGRLDRELGHGQRAWCRAMRCWPSGSGAQRLLAQAHPAAQHGLAAELVLAADQFLIKPAGRIEDAARASGRGRRSADGDRRLSLVHRLGPRHDDQPGRADAVDGAVCRGGLHPADVCQAHSRRPDSESVSRRRKRGPLSHGRRDAVVLSRAGALRGGDARPGDARRAAAQARSMSPSITCRERGSTSASIRRTDCCGKGRRAISSPGWTPRSAIGS